MARLDNCGTVVVTGGTGSFGSAFVRYLIETTDMKVRVLSRDEHKQQAMMAQPGLAPGKRLTYIQADVRDLERLKIAFDGACEVVHSAALKIVPAGERHTDEFVKTNIVGTMNVIQACVHNSVERSLLISSDKCVSASNTYGATKRVAESLFIQANSLGSNRGCRFSIVRGGNVWGSRGSVMEKWLELEKLEKPLEIFDARATRFHLPMDFWVKYVRGVLDDMYGAETYVPKLQAWSLSQLAGQYKTQVAFRDGRTGDKQHEYLIGDHELSRSVDMGWTYLVNPPPELVETLRYHWRDGFPVEHSYMSNNVSRLTSEELGVLVEELRESRKS